ncbi:hypothetical protein UFOVP351_37 [uncultured Caudovirales phage]|uniref:Uncharacterized protein n=1 Tax=uncultured Caudovirales phage TaxID=2100421 RepID=A0A6J5LZJ2_9CAUD|nr:hypothetical protein UFOVP351_37 [uncultured Caudovirales phage]
MNDLYLRAADEAEMTAALIDAGLAYEEDGALHPAFGVSLDVIGPIPDAVGWHVNVRTPSLTEAQFAQLQPVIIVPPEQPYRVWA